MVEYSKDELETIIETAVAILHKDHKFLLVQGHDINERTVTSQLRAIIDDLIPEYHVDAEYNRMWKRRKEAGEGFVYDTKKSKRLEPQEVMTDDEEATTVFPDIIVHIRGTDINLLIIEVKMEWKKEKSDEDKKKLRGYTQGGLSYNFGAYVEIGESGLSNLEWFLGNAFIEKEKLQVAVPATE